MPKHKLYDEVYFMRNNSIYVGRIMAVHVIDSLNTLYLIQGDTYSEYVYDTKVYGNVVELVDDLKGVIRR